MSNKDESTRFGPDSLLWGVASIGFSVYGVYSGKTLAVVPVLGTAFLAGMSVRVTGEAA